jgi:hypothetical protein
MKRTRLIIGAALIFLCAVFLVLSWHNSIALTSVSIHLKEGVKEHMDHTLLTLGAEHRLPDYKVQLRVSRKFLARDLGTKLNTSATNWLEYPVTDHVPFRQVQEVVIIEDDKVENDLLERMQVTGTEMQGAIFRYRLTTNRSFDVGMEWFFDTPVGKAVTAGIVIGIAYLIISKAF